MSWMCASQLDRIHVPVMVLVSQVVCTRCVFIRLTSSTTDHAVSLHFNHRHSKKKTWIYASYLIIGILKTNINKCLFYQDKYLYLSATGVLDSGVPVYFCIQIKCRETRGNGKEVFCRLSTIYIFLFHMYFVSCV